MPNDDDNKMILRRGRAEHGWHQPSDYVPPVPKEPFRWRPKSDAPPKTPEERAGVWASRVRLGIVVLLTVSLGLLALKASVQGFKAEGVSMEPTLHDGDNIVVSRLAYAQMDFGLLDWAPLIDPSARWGSPGRGDVIVFNSPVDGRVLVKRVIGLPGETVAIQGNDLYINGILMLEPWGATETMCNDGGDCAWRVPDDHYFVLGDNRLDSRDSREGWTVPVENIDGKKLLTY